MPVNIENLESDRKRGKEFEIDFCERAMTLGYFTFRFQESSEKKAAVLIGKNDEYIILPDVLLVCSKGRKSILVEVKGKYPNVHNSYRLEEYRFNSILKLCDLTDFLIMYAIFDTREKVWYGQYFNVLRTKKWKSSITLPDEEDKRKQIATLINNL